MLEHIVIQTAAIPNSSAKSSPSGENNKLFAEQISIVNPKKK
jgi:hypothetical protein